LSKLRELLLAEDIVAEISRETLRRILREGGVSGQTTTTWKASTDPDFIPKMRRVLDLYDHPPADGRVVCVDELGPLNLQPRTGKTWQLQRRPRRLRATCTRPAGVMHMLADLDLQTGKLHYRIRALNCTDHRSHAEQNAAIASHVRWRNTRAQPKVDFAVGSPIRSWTDCRVKAA
jgi:hypothetical protein